ncbi:unnamed protein product [Effrenium voratum]|nr:unnamed protein product [Effrenium voratum]
MWAVRPPRPRSSDACDATASPRTTSLWRGLRQRTRCSACQAAGWPGIGEMVWVPQQASVQKRAGIVVQTEASETSAFCTVELLAAHGVAEADRRQVVATECLTEWAPAWSPPRVQGDFDKEAHFKNLVFQPGGLWCLKPALKQRRCKVCVLGGSISLQSRGYRPHFVQALERRGVAVEDCPAAVGTAGSRPLSLVVSDLVLTKRPDLLIIEVAVNDGDDLLESTPHPNVVPILQAAEGIVRTVRRRCPGTAILFLEMFLREDEEARILKTGSEAWKDSSVEEAIGWYHDVAPLLHRHVCRHYGLAQIDLVPAFRSMSAEMRSAWFRDDCHHSDAGGEAVGNLLAKLVLWSVRQPELTGSLPKNALPAPLDAQCWCNGKTIRVLPGWLSPEGTPRKDKDLLRLGQQTDWLLLRAGGRVTIPFKGRACGILTLLGPDAPSLQVRVDNGAPQRVCLLDRWCYFWRDAVVLLCDGLVDATHVLDVEVEVATPDQRILKRPASSELWEEHAAEPCDRQAQCSSESCTEVSGRGSEERLWRMTDSRAPRGLSEIDGGRGPACKAGESGLRTEPARVAGGSRMGKNRGRASEGRGAERLGLRKMHRTRRFIWVLLPEFLERPTSVAAAAAMGLDCRQVTSRAVNAHLRHNEQLHVSHLSLHPNSLKLGERPLTGCLTNVVLERIVSVQFHMPRLLDVLALLEGLTGSSCRCLRKIADRQSRWRPRELRFESMEEEQRAQAAKVTEMLNALPSLQHLEGPVFSVLLRARRHAVTEREAVEDGERSSEAGDPCATAPGTAAPQLGESQLASRLRVLHLIDLCAADLFGLFPSGSGPQGACASTAPSCPNLQKLLLLNLPAAAPGLTVQVISKFLPLAPDLKELQLDFQYFDPAFWDQEALEALITKVQAPPSKIRKLVLDWCRLGDAGVRCVCAAVARHCGTDPAKSGSVRELSLAHCELKDLAPVCEMLETPGCPLTCLDLSANGFGDEEAVKLAKSLPLSKVKELRLRDSQVSERMPVKTKWSWSC